MTRATTTLVCKECGKPAMVGSDRCIRHGGLRTTPETPGAALIDELVRSLAETQAEYLYRLIEEGELPSDRSLRLFNALSANAARLGRLLRDRRAISGEAADSIAERLARLLDEVATEMGVPGG